ncbi:MAG: hypothetical protein HN411_06845 [Waddliaceae bacterium]|jgi:hypothetical protein|nr:hypothetical protein [Waddliaceae bacterium]MBT3579164.1 hypothetical protein [Waddliaceae bacterium]MBT4444320.1 hypothetical protein [Waddliaceae bacterium]MBT6928535.1 hypothetical protein [Waddliaceae bacterium]MBT7264873.1 hypothetical protein [Waddliaceae bacterium]
MQPRQYPSGPQGQQPQRPPAGGLTEVRDSMSRHADAPPLKVENHEDTESSDPKPLHVLWNSTVTPFTKDFFSRHNKIINAPRRFLRIFYRLFFLRLQDPKLIAKRPVRKAAPKKKKAVRK